MRQAPWTEDEVKSLEAYQEAGVMHPFTCPHRDLKGHEGTLVPTAEGWVCPQCDYKQDWAHEFMLNWAWKEALPDTILTRLLIDKDIVEESP